MKANFRDCLDVTLRHEGGYVNDPHDPGGETKFGISKRAHPKEDIKGMTLDRAAQIYQAGYWAPLKCDLLPDGLDLVAFDGAVNSGQMRGAKWLQRALGVTPDGRVGKTTIEVAHILSLEGRRQAISAACKERLDYLRGLKTWDRYKNGWTARVNDIEVKALAMTAKPEPQGKPVAAVGLAALILTALASFYEQIRTAIASLFGG